MNKIALGLAFAGLASANAGVNVNLNVQHGERPSWSGLKATWGRNLNNDWRAEAEYDHERKSDFFSEASVAGKLVDNDDYKVDARVRYHFDKESANVEVGMEQNGLRLSTNYDAGAGKLSKVEASKHLDMNGQSLHLNPSWHFDDSSLRVKARQQMTDNDHLGLDVQHGVESKDTSFKVHWDRKLNDDRHLAAQVDPQRSNLNLKLTDTGLERDATWRLEADVPYDNADNMRSGSRFNLRRSWSF